MKRKTFLVIPCLIVPVLAQTTTDPVFRADIRLAEITVAARDRNGHPVADLKREEFEVIENGEGQPIRFFAASAQSGQRAVPEGVFTNNLSAHQSLGRGPTIFFLDYVNTDDFARYRARQKMIDALRLLPKGEKAALYLLDSTALITLYTFTEDPSELARALQMFPFRPSVAGSLKPPDTMVAFDPHQRPAERAAEWKDAAALTPSRIQKTLSALEYLAQSVQMIPGRKPLIWVSGGFALSDSRFRSDLVRVTATLRAANVALYPVDARGLARGPWAAAEVMSRIAEETGGRLYYNRNDIDAEIRSAFEANQATYTLGYYRLNPDGNTARPIRVNVLRKGVEISFWESGAVKPVPEADSQASPVSQKSDAESMNLTVHATRTGEVVAIKLHIDPDGVTLHEDHGRWRSSVEVGSQFALADGQPASMTESKLITADVTEQGRAKLMAEGLDYRASLTVPRRAATLYLRVHNYTSARAGIISIPLSLVPAANAER